LDTGGNFTGLSDQGLELIGKRLELLKQLVPTTAPVGVIWDRSGPRVWQVAEAAARERGWTRTLYRRRTDARLVGRAAAMTRMPYVVSTLLACAVCGGPMHATKRTGQRAQPRHYYVCTAHRVRGNAICPNALSAPMEGLDGAVAEALARDVLSPDLVADVVDYALATRERVGAGAVGRRVELEAELRRLDAELARYAEAIDKTDHIPALLEALRGRQWRRQERPRLSSSIWMASAWQRAAPANPYARCSPRGSPTGAGSWRSTRSEREKRSCGSC